MLQVKTSATLNPEAAPFQSNTDRQPDTAILHSTTQFRPNVLLKTAIAKVSSAHYTTDAHILLDEGAQRSFITEKNSQKNWRSNRREQKLSTWLVSATAYRMYDKCRQRQCFLITDEGEIIAIDVAIVPTIAVPLSNIQREVTSLKYMRTEPSVTDENVFEIFLLIGADSYWKIVQNHVVRGNGPTAVQSKIGYLLSGTLPVSEQHSSTHCMLNVITSPPNYLDLERFWKLESIGITPLKDDTSGSSNLKTYMDTCISYNEGRYSAKLPWKDDHPPLPTNYDVSLKRTESPIRRLRKEPFLLRKYGEIISEQKERGFIETVDDSVVSSYQIHYIPHHGVQTDSVTTPIRIVYDCSCHEGADKPSLNDCLQSTPPELNDLAGILIQFRFNKYAITTDIEKAFLRWRFRWTRKTAMLRDFLG